MGKGKSRRQRDPPDESQSVPDLDAAFENRKKDDQKQRTTLRRQISLACKSIGNLIKARGSRRSVRALLNHATDLLAKAQEANEKLMDPEQDETDFDHHYQLHLHYLSLVEGAKEQVEEYLAERAEEPESVVDPARNLDRERLEKKRQELLEARQKAEIARQQAEEAAKAVQALEKDAGALSFRDPAGSVISTSESVHSLPEEVVNPHAKVEDWRRRLPDAKEFKSTANVAESTPDDWIDEYRAGREHPQPASGRKRSAVTATLEDFDGRALDWFQWIDLFHALVHESSQSPGEKLAILKRSLRGDARDVVYGLGGGEDAYKEALGRLKEAFGRRDVMRAAHIQALDKLEYKKGDSAAFKKFAERARSHLFDLNRIGGGSAPDIIERLCLKLDPNDCIAWTADRGPGVEVRDLNQFGSWLCSRAGAYLNAISVAASQDRGDRHHSRDKKGKTARTNKASGVTEEEKRGDIKRRFCFHCEKPDHGLVDCKDFKDLPVPERFEFMSRRRLCFLCLRSGHSIRTCRIGKSCGVKDCPHQHNPLLHETPKPSVPEVKATGHHAVSTRKVALGVISIDVCSSDGSLVPANLMFDEGSDTTLVREALARRLKISGRKQTLNLDGVGGSEARYDSQHIRFQVRSPTGECIWISGSTLPTVTKAVPMTDWTSLKDRWQHLADLPVRGGGGTIDILLGLDHAHLMAVSDSRVGGADEPVAARTALGWIVRGVMGVRPQHSTARIHTAISSFVVADQLEADFRRFCDTEAFGTEHKGDCISPENKRAVSILDEGVRKLDVGYEAPITWKEGEPNLPDNRKLAEHRLQGLLKRFSRDPDLEKDYRAAIQKYFDMGYACKLSEEEAAATPCYFLPHHGVYKNVPGKKKLRVVFDSAARYKGKCLNDAVCSGPSLQTKLPAVLIRFREGAVAFTSDIEAMFSRIRLRPEDARYHRFLWQERGSSEVITCQMNRLTFGDSCSPFIAIYTTRRAAQDSEQHRKLALDVIEKKAYVDDILDSAPTVEAAVQRAGAVNGALADGDFHLQGWTSNSKEFLRAMQPGSEAATNAAAVPLVSESAEAKALGVYWKPEEDVLTFSVSGLDDVSFTRVELLSKVAGVFDPLGLAAPMIVKAKIKMRELGTRGLDWNDAVTEEEKTWWKSWFDALRNLNDFTTPRCLFPDEEDIVRSELHTFSDASEEAYASAVYLRHVYSDGRVVVRLVMAKSKLAPKKTISVAKLELNAAVLGSRLASFVLQSLTRSDIVKFYWTDSSCVRNWIRATAAFYKPFVSHRIGEIQTLTEPNEWRFVPGKLNSSDAATRSNLDSDEAIPTSWTNGPDFLLQPMEQWPKDLPWMVVAEESRTGRVHHAAASQAQDWTTVKIDPADLAGLIRLENDFVTLIRCCQEEAFEEELNKLREGKPIRHSNLLALTPQLGPDGLLRLGGRIGRAKLPYDNLHPVLLPAKHPLTEKIITAFHQHLHHAGTDFLLAHIRQHFWVVKGREAVKRIRSSCLECRKETARPAGQMMGELPEERLDYGTPPFTRTAVDYFGPLEVGFARNRTAKRYGALFTCLVTRAVYLDLAHSLSTDDFLLVFRRFISTHRKPESVHSDNGLNFVGAERELVAAAKELNESNDLQVFCQEKGITWKFQPPVAPHFGGAHESLVRSSKRALYRALESEKKSGRLPTDDMLRTLLFEIAGLLNSRPLTYASSDPDDFRPLTPNDFLNKPPTVDVPPGNFKHAHPREHYKYVQRAANIFWDLWKTQFLQTQAARKKWKMPKRNFAVGDVVLLADPNLKRGEWSLGRVTEVFPAQDGLVRVARVKTERGEYVRPIHRFCLLEAVEESGSTVPVQPASGEDVPAK